MDPIIALSPKQITSSGRLIVLADPTVAPTTLEALIRSEKELVPKHLRGYMRAARNKQDSVDWFYERSGVRAALLSVIISDDPSASFAEVAAEYAVEAKLPFVLCAVLISDLMELEGIAYFKGASSVDQRRVLWVPGPGRSEVLIRRKSNGEYSGGTYIAAYKACGCNKTKTAELLGVSRHTVTAHLQAAGYKEEEEHDKKRRAFMEPKAREPGIRSLPPTKSGVSPGPKITKKLNGGSVVG